MYISCKLIPKFWLVDWNFIPGSTVLIQEHFILFYFMWVWKCKVNFTTTTDWHAPDKSFITECANLLRSCCHSCKNNSFLLSWVGLPTWRLCFHVDCQRTQHKHLLEILFNQSDDNFETPEMFLFCLPFMNQPFNQWAWRLRLRLHLCCRCLMFLAEFTKCILFYYSGFCNKNVI